MGPSIATRTAATQKRGSSGPERDPLLPYHVYQDHRIAPRPIRFPSSHQHRRPTPPTGNTSTGVGRDYAVDTSQGPPSLLGSTLLQKYGATGNTS